MLLNMIFNTLVKGNATTAAAHIVTSCIVPWYTVILYEKKRVVDIVESCSYV
jgi:hypothetical protein